MKLSKNLLVVTNAIPSNITLDTVTNITLVGKLGGQDSCPNMNRLKGDFKMGNYHLMLNEIMEWNNYCNLPNYPFDCSLDEIEYDVYDEKTVETYCYNVLSDIKILVDLNEDCYTEEKDGGF
jgi:hypothetical protein